MRIETTILSNLIFNEEYSRKVIPFLKRRYFSERKEAIVFEEISKFFETYNKPITPEILAIEVNNRKDISDSDLKDQQQLISELKQQDTNEEWLLNETENFCQKKAVYNAILDAIGIIDGKDKNRSEDAIPCLLYTSPSPRDRQKSRMPSSA